LCLNQYIDPKGEIMNIQIHQIDHNSKYLNNVISLGDANKKTLGLFPKEAYKESASKKRIIVAIDEDTDVLIGYLLFSTSRRKMLVSIVHLCVSDKCRGQNNTGWILGGACTLSS